MRRICETCKYALLQDDIYPCSACTTQSGFIHWEPQVAVDTTRIPGEFLDLPPGKITHNTQVGGTHYIDSPVQPWDVIDTWPQQQRIGAYRAGVLKYLMRCGSKDAELQELRKAQHYLSKLIETLEKEIA